MKRTLIALSVLTGISFGAMAEEPAQDFFEPGRVDVMAGLNTQEGETGYFVSGQWNISQYAALGLAVDSYTSRNSYPAAAFTDSALFASRSFRPRHTTYSLSGTARYPFSLGDESYAAPFLTVGFNQMSTEDVEIGEASGEIKAKKLRLKRRNKKWDKASKGEPEKGEEGGEKGDIEAGPKEPLID